MKRFCFLAIVLLLGVVVSPLSHSGPGIASCWAGIGSPTQKSGSVDSSTLRGAPMVCGLPGSGISCGTNGIYKVYVIDGTGVWAGQYTVATGESHPAGPDLSVLSGGDGGLPWTSYLTVRVYNPGFQPPCPKPPCVGVEYIQDSDNLQDHLPDDGYSLESLGQYATIQPDGRTVIPIGPADAPTGFQTTYELKTPQASDNMIIVQVVNVNETTYEDSTVEVTTTVKNTGTTDLKIGIRYRWDLQVGLDDGPTLQPGNLNEDKFVPIVSPPLVNEVEYSKPLYVMSRIVDNDVNPNPPTYYVFATNTGPDWVRPKPTPPALFQYACFYRSYDYAFDLHPPIDPSFCIALNSCGTCTLGRGGDSVILYYFGETPAQAIIIKPGETYQVSESLCLSPTKEPPPGPHPPTVVPALSSLAMIAFFILLAGIYAVFMGRKRKREGRY